MGLAYSVVRDYACWIWFALRGYLLHEGAQEGIFTAHKVITTNSLSMGGAKQEWGANGSPLNESCVGYSINFVKVFKITAVDNLAVRNPLRTFLNKQQIVMSRAASPPRV